MGTTRKNKGGALENDRPYKTYGGILRRRTA